THGFTQEKFNPTNHSWRACAHLHINTLELKHEKNGKAPLHLHFERLDQNGKIVASYIYEVIR
ncbi:MAG: hypothetical protein JAY75_21935, partial [Candidatus Thiodiazotropha taylori]|nr:hypothetical protein [Candidatus Thiodiazotropha taylori]MCG8117769.1 hypothetical protein [Candidatus Thiodiazotropha taylori]MCW4302066.1 hypothetical protein [Candidatus Thiodiazotropha endolucinida]MCW4310881.1 hypothetical protein [Candidatus Thiodiazotropha endolucinida]